MGTPLSSPKLRAWFLRNLLEAAERELGVGSLLVLPERAPARLRPHLSLDRLRTTSALDTVPLDEGEDAILAFEQVLGDGSGRTLERVACEMLARQLVQASSAVRVGDLYGTVSRLRAPLEHPFVDVAVNFDVTRTPTGLRLAIGILGRPRSTRMLGHIAVGAIHAAERFAREANTEPLRIETAMVAERTRIDAHFRRGSVAPPPPDPSPVSRRSSGASRLLPSLSDEVARILDASLSPDRSRPSEEPVRRNTPEPRSNRGVDSEPRPSRPLSEAPPARSEPFIRRSSRPPPGR